MQWNKNVLQSKHCSSQRICSFVSVLLTSFRGECIQGCSHTWIDWRRCAETRGRFPRWLGSWAEITHKRWSWSYFCVRCPTSGKCARRLAAPWLILLLLSSVSRRCPTKSVQHAWGGERKALPGWCVLWPTLQYCVLNTKWPKGNMQIDLERRKMVPVWKHPNRPLAPLTICKSNE